MASWFQGNLQGEEAFTSDIVAFEQHQVAGWSTEIAQPIRSIEQVNLVSSLSAYESK